MVEPGGDEDGGVGEDSCSCKPVVVDVTFVTRPVAGVKVMVLESRPSLLIAH